MLKKISLWLSFVILAVVMLLRLIFAASHLKLDSAVRYAFDPNGTYFSTVRAMGDNLSLYGLHKTIICAFKATDADGFIPAVSNNYMLNLGNGD